MTDIADDADIQCADNLAHALKVRKPIPKTCERCPEPSAVIDGQVARFCEECLLDFRMGGA